MEAIFQPNSLIFYPPNDFYLLYSHILIVCGRDIDMLTNNIGGIDVSLRFCRIYESRAVSRV